MEGDPLAVFHHPDNSSFGTGLLHHVKQLGHLDDDVRVLSFLCLEQFLDLQDTLTPQWGPCWRGDELAQPGRCQSPH